LTSFSDETNKDINKDSNTGTNTDTNLDTNTGTNQTTTAGTDQSPPAQDSKPSMFSKCTTEVSKSISTLGDGLGLVMKAAGQAALTVIGTLFGTYNGLISVTAKTGETVAAGLNLVDNVASRVVLVNTLTGGASKLATGLATTFSNNSKITSANREKLFDEMDQRLDKYNPHLRALPIALSTNESEKSPDSAVKEAEQEVTSPAKP